MTLQQYADKHGISVTDADVDAQIVKDGTLPECATSRSSPSTNPTPPASAATAAELTAAQTKAQGYLDSIKIRRPKKWDDVFTASQVLTGTSVSASGDMGLVTERRP
jgi:hypothetical protein